MEYFGPHLMLDIKGCKLEQMTDYSLIYKILDELPSIMDMTKITLPYVVKWKDKGSDVEGLSGFVMIAESHISIHTFPQNGLAVMDIFSCKNFDKDKAVNYIKEKLQTDDVHVHFVMRGEGHSIKTL